jgi:CubicO group peptidase (beta-lactamase class C family)
VILPSSAIAERVGGMPFAELARDRIFRPSGMGQAVVVDRPGRRVPHRATGSKAVKGRPERSVSPCIMTGDGNVFATIRDMAAWDAALREHMPVGAKTLAQA